MKARWWWSVLLAALLGVSAVAHACDSSAPGGSQSVPATPRRQERLLKQVAGHDRSCPFTPD